MNGLKYDKKIIKKFLKWITKDSYYSKIQCDGIGYINEQNEITRVPIEIIIEEYIKERYIYD